MKLNELIYRTNDKVVIDNPADKYYRIEFSDFQTVEKFALELLHNAQATFLEKLPHKYSMSVIVDTCSKCPFMTNNVEHMVHVDSECKFSKHNYDEMDIDKDGIPSDCPLLKRPIIVKMLTA